MSIRIIAGSAKGIRLESPKGIDVRPTLDRVRESVFNVIGPDIEGMAFLDLFAGTGAVGIEALSRGVARVTFVESNPKVLALVRRNLEKAKVADRAHCMRLDVPGRLPTGDAPFDLIYADPPYRGTDHQAVLTAIQDAQLLAKGGWLILETAAQTPLPAAPAGLEVLRELTYGDTRVAIFA